ncbi:MAG: ATP-dependent RecD-like DNA helicase [Oenococcus sp.]|uniref:SF1B family DNA helicase RecD2 n=1 Tax=Oenococcus TaxID=46254 RepID=UPI0021E92BB7|nr:ATP-dependent RecD-like DNA helicase [Oenococcus kitaharae]MCV3295889.1 ATP-dependent RecD-like DNA helicase [Oenococcus kitaharae]
MPELTASVKRSFFVSSDSGYAVFSAKVSDSDFDWEESMITLTGEIADLKVGESYEFSGQLTEHPRYGKQFKVVDYQSVLPNDNDGLVDFLSSDLFPGIGRTTAEKVVDSLGSKTIELLTSDDSQLQTLSLTKKQLATLKKGLLENQEKTSAFSQTGKYGLSQSLIERLFDEYGLMFTTMLAENPYQFIGQVEGFTFDSAEQVARVDNFQDEKAQIQGAIVYALLSDQQENGGTYLTETQLFAAVAALLHSDPGFFDKEISENLQLLKTKKRIVLIDDRISLVESYNLEKAVVKDLKRLISFPEAKDKQPLAAKTDAALDKDQLAAVKSVFQNRITILTGGPGTGKTTVIKEVIHQWHAAASKSQENDEEDHKKTVLLAAPTGRAAARITEVTGKEAVTIHRLLGATADGYFDFDESNQLQAGLIVVDEMSMVDLALFQHFLCAVPNHCTLLLVGDKDQLASVGAGQILNDLILSEKFATIQLQTNHRQTKGSGIDLLSQDMKQGIVNPAMFQNSKDVSFFALEEYQLDRGINRILSAAMRLGIKKEDLQIITPTNRLVDLLNQLARPFLIDSDGQVDLSADFLPGDRVMQQENDPEKGVNNGDIGYVTAAHLQGPVRSRFLSVDFLGSLVTYKENEIKQLRLSYASTVHKSQGSEFKNVIFVLTSTFNNFVTRNLVYTGVTRAEKSLIMIGSQAAFTDAINNPTPMRQTNLVSLLGGKKALVAQKETNIEAEPAAPTAAPRLFTLSKQLIDSGRIDPMIGMADITPRDFLKND